LAVIATDVPASGTVKGGAGDIWSVTWHALPMFDLSGKKVNGCEKAFPAKA
jgi:hypothetical protein